MNKYKVINPNGLPPSTTKPASCTIMPIVDYGSIVYGNPIVSSGGVQMVSLNLPKLVCDTSLYAAKTGYTIYTTSIKNLQLLPSNQPHALDQVLISGYSNFTYSGTLQEQYDQALADCQNLYQDDSQAAMVDSCYASARALIDQENSGGGSGSSTNPNSTTNSSSSGLPQWLKDILHEGETVLGVKPGSTTKPSGTPPNTTTKPTMILGMQPAIGIPVILVGTGALIWGIVALYKMAGKDKK